VTADLIAVAAGRATAGMVIRDCSWVNVHSREVIPGCDIAIKAGRFAACGPDAGRVVGPQTRVIDGLGAVIRDRTRTLGDEGRIATLQLNDLLSGVSTTEELVLQDYIKPLRSGAVGRALERLDELSGPELEDASRVAKELGFSDLDDPAEARGHRLLSKVGRLPDAVREDIVRYFGSVTRLLRATEEQLIDVEGVGETRAEQLLSFFNRLEAAAHEWEPVLD
jgi:diadenylate cyclase